MQRARRRRRILGGCAAVALVTAGALVGVSLGGGSSGDRRPVATRTRPRTSDTTVVAVAPSVTGAPEPSTASVTTPAVALAPPFAVAVAGTTVVDPSRPTAARGSTPAAPSRTLPVTVYVPQAPGVFPLVVFAHGYDIAAADYADLLRDLAAQGFVVAAPDFPASSRVFPGPPTQADIDEQARDVAFLVDAFRDGTVAGPWLGHVASGEAGVVGHSDGGNTVARAASNSCCFTARIGAAVVLAGDEGRSGGTWGVVGSPPMLFVQGTADTVNPWALSQQLYDDAVAPKLLVAIADAGHLEPFTTGPQRRAVVGLLAEYLRGHLTPDAGALQRVSDLANRDGLRIAASS